MSINAEYRIEQTASCILRHKEEIAHILGFKQLLQCEDYVDEVRLLLDCCCGVDWLCGTKANKYYGVACRVQVDRPDKWPKWRTFTVRAESPTGMPVELQKRQAAIRAGSIYPQFTLQIYMDEDDNIDRLALCYTKELISYIEQKGKALKRKRNREDGKLFIAVEWDDYQKKGNKIFVYDKPAQSTAVPLFCKPEYGEQICMFSRMT